MEKCYSCKKFKKVTGVIDDVFTAPIHKTYWKHLVCMECEEKWHICTMHVMRKWAIKDTYQDTNHFYNTNIVHEDCSESITYALNNLRPPRNTTNHNITCQLQSGTCEDKEPTQIPLNNNNITCQIQSGTCEDKEPTPIPLNNNNITCQIKSGTCEEK